MRFATLFFLFVAAIGEAAFAQSVGGASDAGTDVGEGGTGDAQAVNAPEAAAAIVRATNALRSQQAREELVWNRTLAAAAQDFATFMARTDRYGHEADGRRPVERAEQRGYDHCIVAENIAYQYRSDGFGTADLARAFVEGWRNSPPHRRNMLDAAVIESGVGIARSSKTGRWYAVQMFGLPRSAQRRFSISNRAPGAVRYRLGERTFVLRPDVTRTHVGCRPAELVLQGPGDAAATRAVPGDGEHFRVVKGAAGRLRLARQ
jgi:uncharacterized protein YkwD